MKPCVRPRPGALFSVSEAILGRLRRALSALGRMRYSPSPAARERVRTHGSKSGRENRLTPEGADESQRGSRVLRDLGFVIAVAALLFSWMTGIKFRLATMSVRRRFPRFAA